MENIYPYEAVFTFRNGLSEAEIRQCVEILALGFSDDVDMAMDSPLKIRFLGDRPLLLAVEEMAEDTYVYEPVAERLASAVFINHLHPEKSYDLLSVLRGGGERYSIDDEDAFFLRDAGCSTQKAVIKLKKKLPEERKASLRKLIDSAFNLSTVHVDNISTKPNKLVYIAGSTVVAQAVEAIVEDVELLSAIKSFKIYEEPYDVLASITHNEDWEVLS